MGERPYDIITFDCYGTLIDWKAGIVTAFAEAARETCERGNPLDKRGDPRPESRIRPG